MIADSPLYCRIGLTFAAAAAAIAAFLPAGAGAGLAPDPAHFCSAASTLQGKVLVTRYVPDALAKIGPDFRTLYAVRKLKFAWKQPGKIRIEGTSPILGSALLLVDGPTRTFEVPKLRIHQTQNLATHPTQRLSILEYAGLISADTVKEMHWAHVGAADLNGHQTEIYDLAWLGVTSRSHYRVWIDDDTHITDQRAWFDSAGKLKATFRYEAPQQIVPGIWAPTRIVILNADGAVGAETELSDVSANGVLADSLFQAGS
ncbi:MAG: hypothetical protein KGJ62_15380 [Armatimonadetes bacterium]|nr:hypothetical protein [Armatimonadota bacterium]MDE2207495.1 hypothetical protein [Armatimonadota bacterium]